MSNLYSPVFFGTFFQVFLIFAFVYLLGHIVFAFFKVKQQDNNVSLFVKLFIGLVFLVTLYAIIKTKFNTIQIISVVIGIYFIFNSNKNSLKEIKQKLITFEYKQFILLIILLFGIYLLAYHQYYISSKGEVFNDFHFYSNVAYILNAKGVETINLDLTLSTLSPFPYHYFQLWFVSLNSFIFSTTTILSFYLFFVPVFGIIIFQGAMSIASLVLGNKNKYAYATCFVLGILFLIIQNINIPFVNSISFKTFFIIGSWFYSKKLAVVSILFSIILIALIKKEYKIAFLLNLLFLPLYSTLAPSILSGLFFVLTYLVLKKQIKTKQYWLYIAALVGSTAFYMLFYLLQMKNTSSSSDGQILITYSDILSNMFKTIKVYVNVIIFGLLPTITIFSFCYFLFKKKINLISLRKINSNYIYLIIYIAGALFLLLFVISLFFQFDHDAFQLFRNFIDPLFIFIVFLIILKIIKISKHRLFLTSCITVIYFGLLLYNPPVDFYMRDISMYKFAEDEEYFKNISLAIKQSPNAKFTYFRNYKNRTINDCKPFLNVPDNSIDHFTSSYIPIALSVFELTDTISKKYLDKNDFAFYRYAKNNDNLSEKMFSFMQKNNIKFVIIEQNAVYPQEIIQKADTIFENRENKNKFVVLK